MGFHCGAVLFGLFAIGNVTDDGDKVIGLLILIADERDG
jgi:hypothetical protein